MTPTRSVSVPLALALAIVSCSAPVPNAAEPTATRPTETIPWSTPSTTAALPDPRRYAALPAAGRIIASIPVRDVSSIAVSDDAVWVGPDLEERDPRSGLRRNALTRVDPRSNTVVATVPFEMSGNDVYEFAVVFAGGSGAVWVVDRLNSAVVRIDAVTNTVATRIPVPRKPRAAVVAHGYLWVASMESDLVSKIDPATNAVVATILTAPPAGDWPHALAGSPDTVWVAQSNGADSAVVRIDPRTDRIMARIADAINPVLCRVAGAGREMAREFAGPATIVADADAAWYTAGGCESGILRVDARTNATTRVLPGERIVGLELAFGSLWATVVDPRVLLRIDPATGRVIGSLALPHRSGYDVPEQYADRIWALKEGFGSLWVRQEGRLVRIDPAP